jgi:D-isomer specific 2-hydroxyacid dehydrogenase, NAD binding domain
VAVNVPLSDKTRGMFNSETIGKMKKGAVLVCSADLLKPFLQDIIPMADSRRAPDETPYQYIVVQVCAKHFTHLTHDSFLARHPRRV